jgi:nucleoside-triphosphatase
MTPHALLLTGVPGVGKTTVLSRLIAGLEGRRIRGFLTEEIRGSKGRVGFRIETLDGQTATLAHVAVRSPHQVGKYSVDIGALDRMVEAALLPDAQTEVYLIDEIGKMECLSHRFIAALSGLLDSRCRIVATVARHGGGFIGQVKQRPDVELWQVTRQNRDELPRHALEWLAERWPP